MSKILAHEHTVLVGLYALLHAGVGKSHSNPNGLFVRFKQSGGKCDSALLLVDYLYALELFPDDKSQFFCVFLVTGEMPLVKNAMQFDIIVRRNYAASLSINSPRR